jgi:hypothetical protein
MGIMHEAVEDRVGEGRITDDLVPGIDRQLAGDQRRTGAITVLDDLHKVAPLVGREPVWAPVIEDQQIGLGKRAEQTREAAVSVSQFEIWVEALTDIERLTAEITPHGSITFVQPSFMHCNFVQASNTARFSHTV